MCEPWLRANCRIHVVTLIPVTVVLLLTGGLTMAAGSAWSRWLGLGLVLAGGIGIAWLTWRIRCPRMGYAKGSLHLFLRGGSPIRVPIGVVECFLLGQGPNHSTPTGAVTTANLIVRLSESAPDWRHCDVNRSLGHWCDGYVTISGMWCEPLSLDLVKQLNKRLAETKRQRRKCAEMSP